MKYEIVKDGLGNDCITGTTDDAVVLWIPADPANSDYQRYLNPEAEQSTPMVSDEAKTK